MRTSTTTNLLAAAILATLGSALPALNIVPRAGGPAITPIPSTCTVTNPLPSLASYIPAPCTTDALFYYSYYDSFSNGVDWAEQCSEQCYGYGDHTECKAYYWAENIVVPAGYYGSPGGELLTGCLFFNRTLTSDEFVVAPEGQATVASAGNIAC